MYEMDGNENDVEQSSPLLPPNNDGDGVKGAVGDTSSAKCPLGGGGAGGRYGAVDDCGSGGGGWPPWRGGKDGSVREWRLFGSRHGVLLSCALQEAQRALAFNAVVSTLPAQLFSDNHTDPSRGWKESCGGGISGGGGGGDPDGCLYSPTRVAGPPDTIPLFRST